MSSRVPEREARSTGRPVIRRALISDAETLGVIGPAAYAAAYADLWDDGAELARQLDTFGAAAFAELLRRSDARVWVSEMEGSLVGFLTMIVGAANPITREPNGAEIPRIYILPGAQHLGLGRQLLEAAIAEAVDENLTHVWLDVMASADWARSAYLKWGFAELGSKVFGRSVKTGRSDMVVLIKRLPRG
ncbi:Ribosomal protein S18 acetylase RimI [Rhizobiales bacterium GAS113]|nr:Ribosomal protein S18 acetylase RimI [Rhizobiales bacterium GAS113]SEC54063.1 Ribosomal protein S18 acetylase RimI [Rhizobiales bacterium GAS188]